MVVWLKFDQILASNKVPLLNTDMLFKNFPFLITVAILDGVCNNWIHSRLDNEYHF